MHRMTVAIGCAVIARGHESHLLLWPMPFPPTAARIYSAANVDLLLCFCQSMLKLEEGRAGLRPDSLHTHLASL
jgi:hypothetical protein